MCKLVYGVNNTPNNEKFSQLIKCQYDDIATQKDGCSAVVITFDGKIKIMREFINYESVFKKVNDLLPNARIVALHGRIGTGGTTGQENVHFFQSGDYVMAHNGWIHGFNTTRFNFGKYNDENPEDCEGCLQSKWGMCKKHRKLLDQNDTKEDDPACDTLQFLRSLPKPVTKEGIRALIKEKTFNGMAVIINVKTGETFMMIENKAVVYLSDAKTFGAFFSYTPEQTMSEDEWVSAFGVPVLNSSTDIVLDYEEKKVAEGVYKLNLS